MEAFPRLGYNVSQLKRGVSGLYGQKDFLNCDACCVWLPFPALLGGYVFCLSVGKGSPNRKGKWFLRLLIVSGAPDASLLPVLVGLPDTIRRAPIVSGGGRSFLRLAFITALQV